MYDPPRLMPDAGAVTAAAAFTVNISVENISGFKFWATLSVMQHSGWVYCFSINDFALGPSAVLGPGQLESAGFGPTTQLHTPAFSVRMEQTSDRHPNVRVPAPRDCRRAAHCIPLNWHATVLLVHTRRYLGPSSFQWKGTYIQMTNT